jgi:hypothetical protein
MVVMLSIWLLAAAAEGEPAREPEGQEDTGRQFKESNRAVVWLLKIFLV